MFVILSGVLFDEGEKNEVEGSREVWLTGERPEILRLRKSPPHRRRCFAPICYAQNDIEIESEYSLDANRTSGYSAPLKASM